MPNGLPIPDPSTVIKLITSNDAVDFNGDAAESCTSCERWGRAQFKTRQICRIRTSALNITRGRLVLDLVYAQDGCNVACGVSIGTGTFSGFLSGVHYTVDVSSTSAGNGGPPGNDCCKEGSCGVTFFITIQASGIATFAQIFRYIVTVYGHGEPSITSY